VAFEEFGFGSVQRWPAPACAAWAHQAATGSPCCLVLDLGYSATYAVPSLRGRAVQGAVRRLNVGGRLMTAYLQETLSYRQVKTADGLGAGCGSFHGRCRRLVLTWSLCGLRARATVPRVCRPVGQYNLMDESALVNHVKEQLCYVAPRSFESECAAAVGPAIPAARAAYREWILPDFQGGNDWGALKPLPVDDKGRFRRSRRTDDAAGQSLRMELEVCVCVYVFGWGEWSRCGHAM
jgi:hypothetical protein